MSSLLFYGILAYVQNIESTQDYRQNIMFILDAAVKILNIHCVCKVKPSEH